MDDLMRLSRRLISSVTYRELRKVVTEEAIKIFKADRSCLIIKNKKGEFKIKAGVPEEDHGIGEIITPQTGEKFLADVLKFRMPMVVEKPLHDSRVFHMRDIVIKYDITAILLLTIFTNTEDLGILALDYTGRKKISKEVFLKIKDFNSLAAEALLAAYRRKKEEEDLLRKQRFIILGEKYAEFCHDTRNDSVAINTFAKSLLNLNFPEEKRREYLEKIISKAKHFENVAQDALNCVNLDNICKLDSAKSDSLKLEKILLNKFLEECAKDFILVANGCKIRFWGDRRLEKIRVYADPQKLSAALRNIVLNAIEASAKNVVIAGAIKGRTTLITVLNDGEKIDPQIKDHIFSRFATTKKNIGGTGIGLANVKATIDLHKGDIKVAENGKFTFFNIRIPVFPYA
ncbi:MAG: GAF domain-containing sensor histidine kinase [Patescibacteria group bacterium]